MTSLSINRAWSEAAAFVKQEGSLLFPVALALIALPSIIVQWLAPRPTPGVTPDAGPWLWLGLPLILVTLIGSLAISLLALRRETVVGSALKRATRRALALLGAVLLIGLAILLCLIPVSLLGVLVVRDVESAAVLGAVALLMIGLLLGVRLLLVTPIAADTALGPIAILRRSWALTAGHFWRLLALLAVIALVILVLSMAVTTVVGSVALLLGGQQDGLADLIVILVLGLINAIVSVYTVVLTTRIYVQLSEGESSGT